MYQLLSWTNPKEKLCEERGQNCSRIQNAYILDFDGKFHYFSKFCKKVSLTKDGTASYLAMRCVCVGSLYHDICLIVFFMWLAPWQRPLAETLVKPMCT
jgi:hypothetical protein